MATKVSLARIQIWLSVGLAASVAVCLTTRNYFATVAASSDRLASAHQAVTCCIAVADRASVATRCATRNNALHTCGSVLRSNKFVEVSVA